MSCNVSPEKEGVAGFRETYSAALRPRKSPYQQQGGIQRGMAMASPIALLASQLLMVFRAENVAHLHPLPQASL